ncbi:M48 family metalloprotease [Salmonella enterica subsp. enterica serovar Kentucky]|nr:M48 family metalloprotease [Salmonella enterica subsp. enterica serovar Kentucky]
MWCCTRRFRYADNESQLASVMAHEISHVTQRHGARDGRSKAQRAAYRWARWVPFAGHGQPTGGMAALTGTLAGTRRGMISFTQQNEQEADRIGIQVLQRAGFDPQAMPSFLEKLLDRARYSTRPPEILLTHPLPESRLADARNRANQMRPVVVQSSADFYLAKARARECTIPDVTSLPATCWISGLKATCVSNMRRNMAGRCRRWKRASTMKRAKRCSRC